jgi:hypothetical protein
LAILVVSLVLRVTNLPVLVLSGTAIKDVSATGKTPSWWIRTKTDGPLAVQQIDVRAEQALFFPRQIRFLRRGSQPLHLHASRYIK